MKYLIVLLTAALLTACATPFSSEPNADNSQRPSMEQLGRMPLPVGTKLRTAESLIFGVGEGWLGRAVFELPNDATSSYNFFAEQLPRQGWTMIASVRGKKSLLVLTRAERAATIEIEDSGLFSGSLASMTISPVGSTGGAPAGPGVVVQPLGGAGARRPDRIAASTNDTESGEVAEWSNVLDSKSSVGATLPRVRIPPSPPFISLSR